MTVVIDHYHAQIIDRLRDAAKEHGEVAALLAVLAECFPGFHRGDGRFMGTKPQHAYLEAAMDAAAFVSVDRADLDSVEDD